MLYEETDLRMALGIRGWVDVLSLGFSGEALNRYERTKDVRSIAGIQFVRYAGKGKDSSADEVWWSDEQVLPSRFTIRDSAGTTQFAIERARLGADASLLQPAIVRFPQYRVFDLADWLEKH